LSADTLTAWKYHTATSHSLQSVANDRGGLDWPNQPLPFKIYESVSPLPLGVDSIARSAGEGGVKLETLAHLCLYANGITKVIRGHPFRAAACTGALYHIELYLICQDVPGLQAGVYHYAAHDHSFRQLRQGDFRQALIDASGNEPSIAQAPAIIVCTSTFWRNAWKYRARAYRHCFWDSGTVLANLFALTANPFGAAEAHAIPARLVLGFADAAVNRLLEVNPDHEAALCLIALGTDPQPAPPSPPIEPLNLPTQRLSPSETDYPLIRETHAASSLQTGSDAAAWRALSHHPSAVSAPASVPNRPIEDVIRGRGSARRFLPAPIELAQLQTMLQAARRRPPSDIELALTDTYVIVNAVDGLASGTYYLGDDLEQLRPGDFRNVAGFLALGQGLAADAAVNVYSLANLHTVLETYGDRGYRAAQLEGGIIGGNLYLAAYSLGLGATGLTFFDDDVIRFFAPHAANKSVMFLTAIGQPLRRQL